MSDVISRFTAAGAEEYAADVGKMATATDELTQSTKQAEAAQKSFRTQAREMKEALTALAVAGKQNTEEYKKLRDEAGRLNDAMRDVSEELSTAGSDTRGLDKALRATSVLVGGFTAVQGAAALFGDESEDLQKTLLKVNAAMSLLNGLQAIQAELARKDSIFTQAATKAKELYARAVGTASIATKAFTIALTGGLLLALGLLVANWDKVVGAMSRFTDALGLSNSQAQKAVDIANQLKVAADKQSDAYDRQAKRLQALGGTQAEVLELEIAALQLKATAAQKSVIANDKLAQSEANLYAGALIKYGPAIGGLINLLTGRSKAIKGATKAVDEDGAALDDYTTAILNAQAAIAEFVLGQNNITESTDNATEAIERQRRSVRDSTYEGKKGKDQTIQGLKAIQATATETGELQKKIDKAAVDSFADAVAAKIKSARELDDELKRLAQLEADRQKEKNDLIVGSVQQGAGFIIRVAQDATNREIANLERRKELGIVNEKEYQKELAKLKNQAAKRQRAADLANAGFQVIQAILSAFAESKGGIVIKTAAASIAAVFAGLQFAALAASPLPRYKGGVLDLKGPGTATSDSIPAYLSKGESVMTAAETRQHKDALLAMRGNEFQKKYVPVADVPKLMSQRKRQMYYPAPLDKVSTASDQRLLQKIDELILETKFHSQYTKQGNGFAAASKAYLKDLTTVRRGIRT